MNAPVAREDAALDLERFALAWYGQPLRGLLADAGLALPPAGSRWAASGHVVALSAALLDRDADDVPLAVAGGPCIGDCSGFPTLEALYDSVQAIEAGRLLGAPVVLFIGDREEAMARGNAKRWRALGQRVLGWLESVVEALAASPVRVVLTSGEEHEAALAEATSEAPALDPALLDRAFCLGAEEPPALSDEDRALTRRVVQAHLPSVLARHLGLRDPPRVVVAENLQQLGVLRALRALGPEVWMVAHWPAPSLSASRRMYRGEGWDKIPAGELGEVAAGRHPGIHPASARFFARWLDEERRDRLIAATRGGH